jgi:hypothetical protein
MLSTAAKVSVRMGPHSSWFTLENRGKPELGTENGTFLESQAHCHSAYLANEAIIR